MVDKQFRMLPPSCGNKKTLQPVKPVVYELCYDL